MTDKTKKHIKEWVPGLVLILGILTLGICIVWQTIVFQKLKGDIDNLRSMERYEILEGRVESYDADNEILTVISADGSTTKVEVLLKETEAGVSAALQTETLIGRYVAYLHWQDTNVLLTLFAIEA